jgi:hypothetical protein
MALKGVERAVLPRLISQKGSSSTRGILRHCSGSSLQHDDTIVRHLDHGTRGTVTSADHTLKLNTIGEVLT